MTQRFMSRPARTFHVRHRRQLKFPHNRSRKHVLSKRQHQLQRLQPRLRRHLQVHKRQWHNRRQLKRLRCSQHQRRRQRRHSSPMQKCWLLLPKYSQQIRQRHPCPCCRKNHLPSRRLRPPKSRLPRRLLPCSQNFHLQRLQQFQLKPRLQPSYPWRILSQAVPMARQHLRHRPGRSNTIPNQKIFEIAS